MYQKINNRGPERLPIKKTARVSRAVFYNVRLKMADDLPYFFIYTGVSFCSLRERILQKYMPLATCSTGTAN